MSESKLPERVARIPQKLAKNRLLELRRANPHVKLAGRSFRWRASMDFQVDAR
jgi:hypothetical protein